MISINKTHRISSIFAFILIACTSFTVSAKAQLMSPQVLELNCSHLYEIQQRYLSRHITYQSIRTPNLEHRVVEQFIKHLDSSKIYLLEKDLGKIKKNLKSLFYNLEKDKCDSIANSNKLFLSRVRERVDFVVKTLGPKFKFNPNVKVILNPDKRKRPKTMVEANTFHAKYLQYQIANYLANDMKLNEAKQRVVRHYERILREIKETPKREMWANYLDSFARALDPHTSFLSKDELEDFEIQMRLFLVGIGATLSSQDGFTVIEQLVPGGVAYRSGKLKAKDKIIEVAQGETSKAQNVIEMPLRDVVRLIRGKKGTKVRLTILRKMEKGSKRFSVVLTRDKIKLEDEAARIVYVDRKLENSNKKIALITLLSFYADNRKKGRSAAKDMKKLIAEARAKKADAIVLDLSNNGGGSLDDAVKIAGLFIHAGNVVKQSYRSSKKMGELTLSDRDTDVNWLGPLVVLVSRVSASSSEIVSGALQDYKRGVIVGGDHTFGKGTVQSVEYLPPGLGAMKTTVGMFFTPKGKSTQHSGVVSDIRMPSAVSTDEIGEKNLDYSLPPKKISSFLSGKAYVAEGEGAWKVVTPELISYLDKKSQKRIAASQEFKKLKEQIAKNKKRGDVIDVAKHYREKMEAKMEEKVSINETSNKEELKKNALKEEVDNDTGVMTPEKRKKRYLKRPDIQEAINIAVDMVVYSTGSDITVGAETSLSNMTKGEQKNN